MPPFGVVPVYHRKHVYHYNYLSFLFLQQHPDSHTLEYEVHSQVGAQKLLPIYFSHLALISPNRIVKGIKFCAPNFPTFSLDDLERVKDTDKWLSDTHVAFTLMLGPFNFHSVSILIKHRDSIRDCTQRNIWGNLKIKLLDTPFWSQLSEDPDRFGERWRTRVNLLEHDFVVMPIFAV
jgi:hypothetical protein